MELKEKIKILEHPIEIQNAQEFKDPVSSKMISIEKQQIINDIIKQIKKEK